MYNLLKQLVFSHLLLTNRELVVAMTQPKSLCLGYYSGRDFYEHNKFKRYIHSKGQSRYWSTADLFLCQVSKMQS